MHITKLLRRQKLLSILAVSATVISVVVVALVVVVIARLPHAGVLGYMNCGGSPCVNNTEPPVTVSGFIRMQTVGFKAYPEKRIPATNWWHTVATVALQNCGTGTTFTYTGVAMDDQGIGLITIPISQPVPGGNYRFFITGYSHLRREFNCYTLDTSTPYIDLTPENKLLLAGEVSNVYDNYINSLDMSVLINHMFTHDVKSDLNQDSLVNSLDFSNQIYNLFVSGN